MDAGKLMTISALQSREGNDNDTTNNNINDNNNNSSLSEFVLIWKYIHGQMCRHANMQAHVLVLINVEM